MTATLKGEVRFAFATTDGRSASITLDGFLVDGHAPATAPQVRQLSPGVTEVTAESGTAAEWSFAVWGQHHFSSAYSAWRALIEPDFEPNFGASA